VPRRYQRTPNNLAMFYRATQRRKDTEAAFQESLYRVPLWLCSRTPGAHGGQVRALAGVPGPCHAGGQTLEGLVAYGIHAGC
jgi:hypothetical protein